MAKKTKATEVAPEAPKTDQEPQQPMPVAFAETTPSHCTHGSNNGACSLGLGHTGHHKTAGGSFEWVG